MEFPDTRYAKTVDGVHIAYQVRGDGPIDIIFIHGYAACFEAELESEATARLADRLASFSRLTFFDKRGTGLSDRQLTPDLANETNLPVATVRLVAEDLTAIGLVERRGAGAALRWSLTPDGFNAIEALAIGTNPGITKSRGSIYVSPSLPPRTTFRNSGDEEPVLEAPEESA